MKSYDQQYGETITREKYEHICSVLGFTPIADVDLGTMGDQYGDWHPPHFQDLGFTCDEESECSLRQKRFFELERERKASAPTVEPEAIGENSSRYLARIKREEHDYEDH